MVFFATRGLLGPSGTNAGDIDVGTEVILNENGQPVNYLIVNQGIPENSPLYDASCEGTWFLRQDIKSMRTYGSSQFYANSGMPGYLNPDIPGSATSGLDEKIKNAMKTAKIPYHASTGDIMSGANGLSCRAFLLSPREYADGNYLMPADGVPLDYFKGGGAANRIAYYEGEPARHWTRSDRPDGSTVWVVLENGTFTTLSISKSLGVRPAFILPYDFKFTSDQIIA